MPSVSRLLAYPPYAIGESPFKVKGGLYLGTVAYFEKRVRGGFATLQASIEDEKLRAFISQRFLAASYYDVLPVHPLIHAEARACNQPMQVYLRQRAEYQAENDISGVYKVLLKLASPEAVVERLPRLAMQMFSFGKAEQIASADGTRAFVLSGMPAILMAWYTNGLAIYAQHALRTAGAKTCQVTVLPADPDGSLHDVDLVKVRFQVTWTRG